MESLLMSIALRYGKGKLTDMGLNYAAKLLGIDQQQQNPKYTYGMPFTNQSIDPINMLKRSALNTSVKSLISGNAIAPLATIYHIYQYDSISNSSNVPIWILVIGGVGIVFGLATWGYKIIDRIGSELTKITPSRGFIIELSAALSVIIASKSELPVSTTHCQVGSIVGCGLVGGRENIQWKLVRQILWSWVVTLPFTGLLSAGLFSYGYYSPNQFTLLNSTLS